MQRILRNSLRARNRQIKKQYNKESEDLRQEWREFDKNKMEQDREIYQLIKAERRNRREDWKCGDLAPMRDVGKRLHNYGTLGMAAVRRPDLPKKYQGPVSNEKPEHKEWHGNLGNLAKGDRVVVVKGKLKGRIGTIKDIAWERNTLTLEGMNMADVAVPAASNPDPTSKIHFMSIEVPFSIHDVKLVHRMQDEKTGESYEVVIDHLRGGPPYTPPDEGSDTPRHTRYVQGENIEIPWPDPQIQEATRGTFDTPRREVDDTSRGYFPDMHVEPLPPGVIDKLRSKYSTDRTFHDLDYMQQKVMEDARTVWFEERSKRAISPIMERQMHALKATAEREELVPDEKTLSLIDKIRLQKRLRIDRQA